MKEEEKVEKLFKATKDLNEVQDIISNFGFSKYQAASKFVEKCSKDKDYAPLIRVNKTISKLNGNLTFLQLDPLNKRRVLKLIEDSIKEYIAILGTENNTQDSV